MTINNIVKEVEERVDMAKSKQILREKAQSSLIFGYGGGLFKATPELISLADIYEFNDDVDRTKPFVVEDLHGNPILIEDVREFTRALTQRHNEVMNQWIMEYDKLAKTRKI